MSEFLLRFSSRNRQKVGVSLSHDFTTKFNKPIQLSYNMKHEVAVRLIKMTYRLRQIPRKPAILNLCRQTRGKVGKHTFLVKNYSLNMKKLFTRPDFEFLTVKLQL